MQQGEYLEQRKGKGQEPIKQSCLAIIIDDNFY